MRRTLKGFAGSVALLLALAFAGRAHAAVCGDLNGNGSRSTADVVLLFRAVLENLIRRRCAAARARATAVTSTPTARSAPPTS